MWGQSGYKLIWSVVRDIDPALLTLAHEGTKGYQQAYDLIYRREARRPNEIWQADHPRTRRVGCVWGLPQGVPPRRAPGNVGAA